MSIPTELGGDEMDEAVACSADNSEQPSMDGGLIAEDLMSIAAGVEDRVERRIELMTQLEGLQSDVGWNAKEQAKSQAWMEHVLTVTWVTWVAFMEEGLPAGRMKDQVKQRN